MQNVPVASLVTVESMKSQKQNHQYLLTNFAHEKTIMQKFKGQYGNNLVPLWIVCALGLWKHPDLQWPASLTKTAISI